MKHDASATPIRAVAIMGATATGKSDFALALAREFDGEIVSMDSRQAYRGFDIGTGKLDADSRARVRHHLIDVLDPSEAGSAGRHAALAQAAVRDIAARGHVPILAGGTGLYFRALFAGLVPVTIPRETLLRIRSSFAGRPTRELHEELSRVDPKRAAEVSANDRVRVTRALELIAYSGTPVSELYAHPRGVPDHIVYLKVVLSMPRPKLRERIERRTRELFAAGWGEEVRRLLAAGVAPDAPAMNSLGYHEIAGAIVRGEDPAVCLERVITLTQQYAKRQETFLRGEADAVWIDADAPAALADARALVAGFLRGDAPQ